MNGPFFSALPLQMNQKGRTGFQERVSQQDSMTAFMEQYIHLQTGFNGKGLVNLCATTVGCATTWGSAAGPHKHSPILGCWQELVVTAHYCYSPLPRATQRMLHMLEVPFQFSPVSWLICLFLKQLQFITHQSAQFCSHLWLIIKER